MIYFLIKSKYLCSVSTVSTVTTVSFSPTNTQNGQKQNKQETFLDSCFGFTDVTILLMLLSFLGDFTSTQGQYEYDAHGS